MTDVAAYPPFIVKYGGFVPVENKDFGRWRDKNGTGGDFYVFSDVYWMKPDIFKRVEL